MQVRSVKHISRLFYHVYIHIRVYGHIHRYTHTSTHIVMDMLKCSEPYPFFNNTYNSLKIMTLVVRTLLVNECGMGVSLLYVQLSGWLRQDILYNDFVSVFLPSLLLSAQKRLLTHFPFAQLSRARPHEYAINKLVSALAMIFLRT